VRGPSTNLGAERAARLGARAWRDAAAGVRRIGRFESSQLEWKPGYFVLEERSWRIIEILPEVSTMVAYNAVWVAAPI
jgi:hypothetical protein